MAEAPAPVEWKLHLASAPEHVFELLTSDRGRERFWAERSTSSEQAFTLAFARGEQIVCEEVAHSRVRQFAFRYFGATLVEFRLGNHDPRRTWSAGYCET